MSGSGDIRFSGTQAPIRALGKPVIAGVNRPWGGGGEGERGGGGAAAFSAPPPGSEEPHKNPVDEYVEFELDDSASFSALRVCVVSGQ